MKGGKLEFVIPSLFLKKSANDCYPAYHISACLVLACFAKIDRRTVPKNEKRMPVSIQM
jgi:hypothetical protein